MQARQAKKQASKDSIQTRVLADTGGPQGTAVRIWGRLALGFNWSGVLCGVRELGNARVARHGAGKVYSESRTERHNRSQGFFCE